MAQIDEFTAELGKTREQVELIDRLLGLSGSDLDDPNGNPANHAPASVVGALEEVMSEAGKPLHISDIVERYKGRGWKIPGKGLDSNLIAYLSRDPRFSRVSKGTYGLATWAGKGDGK